MSIVSTSNRWLNRLYKIVAILLVLFAVAISAFRLFLPYVHHYRLPLQNYLNDKAQMDISIGTLEMTWEKSGPVLEIDDVSILNTEHAIVSIANLELQIDFWKSLRQQSLISKNLILSGANVDISESWQNNLKETSNKADDVNVVSDLRTVSDLFIKRIKRFSIKDSQISIQTKNITRSIGLKNLHWLNTGDRHQAKGSVVLNGVSSNTLQLKLDLTGESSSNLTGDVYLEARHIDITPWLDNILVLDDEKTKTDINFSAWFNVNDSLLHSTKVDFSDNIMDWSFGNKKQKLTLSQGQLLLVKSEGDRHFNLYSTPLELTLNEQQAQNFTVQLTREADDFSLYLSAVDLAMFTSLTPLIVSDKATRELISKMDLTGKVSDLYIRQEQKKLQVAANFEDYNNHFSKGIPGVENVSGELSFVDDYLSVNFEALKGRLDFDKLFVQAFPYDNLSGNLNVNFAKEGWELTVEQVDFLSKDINLSAQVNVEAPVNGEVTLALLANVSNGNAGLVGRYLPLPIMSDNLVNYLNAAVVSGRVEDAQVLINGPIGKFPFTNGSGIFVVDAELSEGEFKFVKNWPAITDFVANLNFTNNSMLITGRGGSLTGLDVTGVTAGISDLAKGQILTVDADIKSTASSNIRDLMHLSPFKSTVGSTLDYLSLSGNVSGDFNLRLPLKDNTKGLAKGTILFANNKASLRSPQLNFTDIQGQLTFSNDKIATKDLQLVWQGLPVNLDITGLNEDSYYHAGIKLDAQWQESEWQPHVPNRLRRYIHGELPWQGELSLYQHHDGGFSYKADYSSNLDKTELLLPSPYQRDNTNDNAISVSVDGSNTQSTISLNYADKLHFSGLLNHETKAFTRANLSLGEGKMAIPSNGFHITTKLETAEFSQWQPLIRDILDSIKKPATGNDNEKSTPLLATPKRIRGSIDQLSILGQTLNQVSFNLLDKPDWWLLQLNAKETRSQTKIYPNWLERGLDINAEFLHTTRVEKEDAQLTNKPLAAAELALADNEPDQSENDIIFANIPPLNFHCDSCSIGLLDLGEVNVKVKRTNADTISFTQLDAKRKNAQLSLKGRWLHNEENSNTALTGKLLVDDVEKEMKAFSFESIVKDSGLKLDLNFNWDGGLHDLDFTKLNGNFSARLDDGYLAEVSDKAKIFSVLSLQSVVRKLTLDFRDIFSDGMFYSSIKGNYQLGDGILTTANTEMNGTAGNLFVTGQTNLITKALDYNMSYKPELTSSLPVLAWIATLDPVTFLAGVAIDQVIKSQVVSEFNFKLTGTVDNPDFREVDRKRKSVSVDTKVVKDLEKPITPAVSLDVDNNTDVTPNANIKEVTEAKIEEAATPLKAAKLADPTPSIDVESSTNVVPQGDAEEGMEKAIEEAASQISPVKKKEVIND